MDVWNVLKHLACHEAVKRLPVEPAISSEIAIFDGMPSAPGKLSKKLGRLDAVYPDSSAHKMIEIVAITATDLDYSTAAQREPSDEVRRLRCLISLHLRRMGRSHQIVIIVVIAQYRRDLHKTAVLTGSHL